MAVPGGDRAGMGVEAWVGRQQRGMDIDHPPLPRRNEIRRQDAHVTRQGYVFRPGRPYRRRHRRIMFGTRQSAMPQGKGGDALGSGQH